MLKVGTRAPAFSAPTAAGDQLTLEQLRGGVVVLYFFPKAFTSKCTIETKGFRDNYDDLRGLGAEVVGVSTDDMPTQCAFMMKLDVKFPMVADHDRAIARAYDVMWPLLPLARRVTYVIDREGVIAGVFHHEFQVSKHLDEVLRFTRELSGHLRRPRSAG